MIDTPAHPTFCIATLGCKVNKADTKLMQQTLTSQGYEAVPFEHGADIYIINTCTVTAKSDFQSRQLIRRALRQNNQAQIIVTGCYAQTNPAALEKIPGVTLILNNTDKATLEKYLPPVAKGDVSQDKLLDKSLNSSYYTRAFLKIQDGCNWACTYCIVPQARGKSRSYSVSEILEQAKQLIYNGYKEIVLTGIHIGHYGLDLSTKSNLAKLLKKLSNLDGLGRLRLSSLEPTEFSQELLDILRDNDKICPHFHIPLQSADDEILQSMGRRYSFAQYQETVLKLRELFPEAALGADVIVGFPGETETSFQTTYQRIAQLPLTYLHVFSYSKRPNTKAAQLPQQVDSLAIKTRSSKLRELAEQKRQDFYQTQLEKIRPSLILSQRNSENNFLAALSDNYIKVLVNAGNDVINQITPLRITKISGGQVFGEITN